MTAELSPSVSNSPGIRLLKQIFRNRSAQIGSILLLVLIFISYAAPLFTEKDPNKTAPSVALRAPSLEFPMGTDGIGRDNFSRFLYGGRLSLRVGLVGITIGALIGITLGLISGYFGGWLDSFVSWFTDVLMAFPDILLALAIIAILGPGIRNAMLASIFAIGTNGVFLDAESKTMLATGSPQTLMQESSSPIVRQFLTRGEAKET